MKSTIAEALRERQPFDREVVESASTLLETKDGEMIKPSGSGTKLRPTHAATLVVGSVIAVIVAFAAFHFVVGLIAFFVKLVIVVAVVGLLAKFVFNRASR
jgi:hypothetical protein